MIYLELFWTFFLIGAFTFGGGYAMLPLVQIKVAEKGWLPEQVLVDFIAVSEATPGPFVVNAATYVGSEVAGVAGAACATLGVVLPSFVIILIVARCFEAFRNSRIVKGCMSGLKPAAIGLIGTAVLTIGKTVFAGGEFWISLILFAVMTVLAIKKCSPIVIICLSAAAGLALGCLGLF